MRKALLIWCYCVSVNGCSPPASVTPLSCIIACCFASIVIAVRCQQQFALSCVLLPVPHLIKMLPHGSCNASTHQISSISGDAWLSCCSSTSSRDGCCPPYWIITFASWTTPRGCRISVKPTKDMSLVDVTIIEPSFAQVHSPVFALCGSVKKEGTIRREIVLPLFYRESPHFNQILRKLVCSWGDGRNQSYQVDQLNRLKLRWVKYCVTL